MSKGCHSHQAPWKILLPQHKQKPPKVYGVSKPEEQSLIIASGPAHKDLGVFPFLRSKLYTLALPHPKHMPKKKEGRLDIFRPGISAHPWGKGVCVGGSEPPTPIQPDPRSKQLCLL